MASSCEVNKLTNVENILDGWDKHTLIQIDTVQSMAKGIIPETMDPYIFGYRDLDVLTPIDNIMIFRKSQGKVFFQGQEKLYHVKISVSIDALDLFTKPELIVSFFKTFRKFADIGLFTQKKMISCQGYSVVDALLGICYALSFLAGNSIQQTNQKFGFTSLLSNISDVNIQVLRNCNICQELLKFIREIKMSPVFGSSVTTQQFIMNAKK